MHRLLLFLAAAWVLNPARAIENNGGYITTQPTDADVPNWTVGWGASGITGWNYVGQVGGASGVYLGYGWVITAGHVGIGDFISNGITYPAIASSVRYISDANGTADLTLFRISTSPNLPPLLLSTALPVAFSATQAGSSVVMLGFGGGQGLTWGYDTVTETDQLVTPDGYTYISNDFFTDNGPTIFGSASIDNTSNLVGGDSGGGDFTYNTITQKWELTGINEVTGSYENSPVTFSGMIQMDTYGDLINSIVNPTDTPTLPLPWLLLLGCLLLLAASRALRSRTKPSQGHKALCG